jgi:uncharacterized membrane protein YhaH (DUF805 family)
MLDARPSQGSIPKRILLGFPTFLFGLCILFPLATVHWAYQGGKARARRGEYLAPTEVVAAMGVSAMLGGRQKR